MKQKVSLFIDQKEGILQTVIKYHNKKNKNT